MKFSLARPLLLTAMLVLALAGCRQTSPADDADRQSGETVTVAAGESAASSFFSFEVTGARAVELEGRNPGKGDRFLLVSLSITNTYGSAIPMGADFDLGWQPADGGERALCQQLAKTLPDQLPDSYTLEADETRAGDLLFEVPVDAAELRLVYQELWDDDFVGNIYEIPFAEGDTQDAE